MSFILDALKKSETERQQQTGAEFSNVPSSSGEPPSMKWLWILMGLLVVNVAVLLGILLRPDAPAPAEPQASPVDSAPVQTAAEPSFEEQVAEAREQRAERDLATEAARVEATPQAAVETVPAPSPTTIARAAQTRRVRTIDEVRLGGLQIPDLHLDIHVYSETPKDRFVFINMVKQREGSRLDEGVVVSEITPDGVILDYQGTSFLLPRQ